MNSIPLPPSPSPSLSHPLSSLTVKQLVVRVTRTLSRQLRLFVRRCPLLWRNTRDGVVSLPSLNHERLRRVSDSRSALRPARPAAASAALCLIPPLPPPPPPRHIGRSVTASEVLIGIVLLPVALLRMVACFMAFVCFIVSASVVNLCAKEETSRAYIRVAGQAPAQARGARPLLWASCQPPGLNPPSLVHRRRPGEPDSHVLYRL